ncbi:SFT2-domain-containing protein [Exidia glandulosa HHB12029]|uniref:Protein transport protein SFT2 n=1 Tax=Exidia glandulosa HHB12029 TaxID=1314781 RepID=A0A165JSR4_EXIGL|nr:SFT2-domain-containing protein [Exidia glandulosa HHB12029]
MTTAANEQSFRANLSQFRWARGVNDDSQQGASQQPSAATGMWSRVTNTMGGYIPLRSSETSNEDEAYFALGRWDRLLGFGACLLGAAVCFFMAFLSIPLILLKPRKFVMAFSLGSLLVMGGFSLLIGPINHAKHLVSKERLPFTFTYFTSLGLALFFCLGYPSYIGVIVCGVVQVVALVSYVLAYFPGGTTTLRFGGQMALSGARNLLPV